MPWPIGLWDWITWASESRSVAAESSRRKAAPPPAGGRAAFCRLLKLVRRSNSMLIIGELINCTRKKVGAAAAARDVEFFKAIARKQVDAGADVLDVNGGLPGQE